MIRTLRKRRALPLMLLLSVGFARADGIGGIDLDCDRFSQDVVTRISEAKLLVEGADRDQILALVMPACQQAQQSAQTQYEKGREEALKNWLFEDMGGKPGNERLRRKR